MHRNAVEAGLLIALFPSYVEVQSQPRCPLWKYIHHGTATASETNSLSLGGMTMARVDTLLGARADDGVAPISGNSCPMGSLERTEECGWMTCFGRGDAFTIDL